MGLFSGLVLIGPLIAKAKSGLSIARTLATMSKGNRLDFIKMLKVSKSLKIDKGIEELINIEDFIDQEELDEGGLPKYNLHWFTNSAWIESANFVPEKDGMGIMIVTFKAQNPHGPLTFNDHSFKDYQSFISAPSAGKYYKRYLQRDGSIYIKGFSLEIDQYLPKELKSLPQAYKRVMDTINEPINAIGKVPKLNKVKSGVSRFTKLKGKI